MVDHLIETYKLREEPIVLMWRESMNGFYQNISPDNPVWSRDDASTHEHWKKYGPGVVLILKRKYKLTIIKVSSLIRALIKHGSPPDRSGKRTDEAYHKCLPSCSAPTRGFAIFPPGKQKDHPLILAWQASQVGRTITTTENTVMALETAKDYEVISDGEHQKIRGRLDAGIHQSLEDKYPLFPQQSLNPPTPFVD